MNNLFITGATGFVGKNLVQYLADFKITTYVRGVEVNLSGIDVVIHLAGKAHDLSKVSKPEEYYTVNFELTKNIYDGFLQSEAKIFIFISSVKAAADSVKDILSEETLADPRTHYGKSKRMAEEYLIANITNDKKVFILRPCMIHGPGNKGNLNLLYLLVSKGIPWPLASFENERSLLSVENLCFVINEIIKNDQIPSGIYNIADDEAISTNTIIEIISDELCLKQKLWRINKIAIKFIARIGDWLYLPLNSERLNKLTDNYLVSNYKIKQALNIRKLPVDTRTGLRSTIKSFTKNA
jgi:nucleoside-diphosphate-sugar epimerase